MRQIKFRGKRIDNGVWLYGDLMHDNIGGSYIYPIDTENLYKENAVIPDTVGQFTGLLDKNGKEIYEGDIVDSHIQGLSRVVYDYACFCIENNVYSTELRPMMNNHMSVIGNIHDNPELLK